jgi:nucleoside-diphosphate-sugar epimerase
MRLGHKIARGLDRSLVSGAQRERVSRDHYVSPSAEGTRSLLHLAREHSSVRCFVLRSFASLYRKSHYEIQLANALAKLE